MAKMVRIEMKMPSELSAAKKFPEAEKQFRTGVSGLALKAAGLSPKILLEGDVVAIEIDCRSERLAEMLLPSFQKQMKDAVAKEREKQGSCIYVKVFLK